MNESMMVCGLWGVTFLFIPSSFLCVYLVLTPAVHILSQPVNPVLCVSCFQQGQRVTGLDCVALAEFSHQSRFT